MHRGTLVQLGTSGKFCGTPPRAYFSADSNLFASSKLFAPGVFGAHVVAVDAASGSVIAGTLGGWSCQAPGPAQFDGTYEIGALAVNYTCRIYVQPLNGAVGPSEVSNALVSLCRNSTTDSGWPPLQSCVVPQPNIELTTASRSSP